MTRITPDKTIHPPEPVGPTSTLFQRLRTNAPVAFGIDCPIGLPRAYAALHATEPNFPSFLASIPQHPNFLDVAATLAEISPRRPFYPARGIAGMTRAAHAQALGLANPGELCRACDRATAERPAGAPLFWTLGANQSGKAAIAAWQELLIPAAPMPLRLWPFDGPFRMLLAPGTIAMAETYPAEAMRQLGVTLRGSKRRQPDRAGCAAALRAAITRLGATLTSEADHAIADGFGADAAGEDRFDSMLGALCVLAVVLGARTDEAPNDPWIRNWEGWVLGQTAHPSLPVISASQIGVA